LQLILLFVLHNIFPFLYHFSLLSFFSAGLKTLRSALAMIPQEAVLIEGSVRENLDPFNTLKGASGTAKLETVLNKVGVD
jgi:hypothetical protein